MDNFSRNPRHSKPTSIDGFLVNRRKGSLVPNTKRPKGHSSPALNSGQRLDDIARQPDGFTPRHVGGSAMPDGTAVGRHSAFSEIDGSAKPPKVQTIRSWSVRRVAQKSAMALFLLFIFASGYIFGQGYLQARQIFRGGNGGALALIDGVDPSRLTHEGNGRVNVLLLAVGGYGHDGSLLTDTVMVASIDPIQKDAALLSIPRDLWVKYDGQQMKINAVYETALMNAQTKHASDAAAQDVGFQAVEQKVTEITGLPINYHGIVDFAGFQEAIDAVGGITLDVKQPLIDEYLAQPNGGSPYLLKAGVQHVDGKHALFYAQSRHGTARGDFDRTQHQREVLVALKDKIFSLGTFSNPIKVSQLMTAFGQHIQSNFSINDIMDLYNIGKQIDSSKISSVGLADPPHELVVTDDIGDQSIVRPKAGLYNYKDVRSFILNTIKDGFIRKENPSILVLNGTNSYGAATARANELKSYGYNVVGVDDAPTKDYTDNVLVDMKHGDKRYTKRYLELRFDTKATSHLPDGINAGTADFVIIVGQNGTTPKN